MITIIGTKDVPEFRAAERLRHLITQEWPDVMDSERDHISIVVAAKCFGCSVQDIDLIVIGNLAKPRQLPAIPNVRDKQILSFVWTVEVKSHPSEKIEFYGGKVFVPYGQFKKDASEQSFKQRNSLRDYLKRNIKREPFCSNFIWLENAIQDDLPHVEALNVLAGNSSWADFLMAAEGASRQWLLQPGNNLLQAFLGSTREQYLATSEVCALFGKAQTATPIDRKRVERISRQVIEDQAYAQKMGEQLLIFRGRGGTGKTITLIRLALDLHLNHLHRVLLLTYNVALVADIRRTLAIIGATYDADGPVVQVRTVHSFMMELMHQAAIIPEINEEALEAYDSHLEELNGLVEAFTGDDAPAFDYVFIDEAQDWPERERDIIFKLFGARRTVVADGVDQLVRSRVSTDWTARIGNTPKQVVALRRSLRLKHSLATFANLLAEELGLSEWNLQANPQLSGGRITVLIGPLEKAAEHIGDLLKDFASGGNYPVDSLICVPYTSAASNATRQIVDIATGCGHEIWDGTDKKQRRSFATSPQQVRIVTYESCRGLEGWSVLCFQVDKLYDQKFADSEESSDLLISREEAAARYAASWVMIPTTRAIDHLVMHVEDPSHPLALALRLAARSLGNDSGIRVIESS